MLSEEVYIFQHSQISDKLVAISSPSCVFYAFGGDKNVWNIDDTNRSKEEVASLGLEAMEAWMNELGLIMNISELGATREMVDDLVNATIILEGGYKLLNKEEIKEIFIKSL